MNAEAIQELCVEGTRAYLNFLVINDRGLQVVRVISKEQVGEREDRVFKLMLAARLFDPDSVSLRLTPPNETFGPKHFQVVEYDGDAKVLIVRVIDESALDLETRPAEGLDVISDLRFLVRNVQRWFKENGRQLQLPSQPPPVHPNEVANERQQQDDALTASQRDAVLTSLTNPLTYIWGPPGTGKTRHVLTRAVLGLVPNKRVGIFAPTNSALEQAMEAIIREAVPDGIGKGERDKFLRIGHPSSRFAREFPEACEVQGLERRLKELRRQIRAYETVLNHRRGATVLNSAATFQHDICELIELRKEHRKIFEQLAQLGRNPVSRVIQFLDGSRRALEEEASKLETVVNGRMEMVRRCKTESPRLNAIVERLDFTNVEQTESKIARLEKETRQYLEVNQAIAAEYEGQSTEQIQGLKRECEQQVRDLEAQTAPEKIKKAWVTGMTLDCFIGRFHDTYLPFDHIFLDEAGYAPLVKALTLCRGGIPLTFIGDHKQLGPVCEMNDDTLADRTNSSAIIWKRSALFLDEPFRADNPPGVITQLESSVEPMLVQFSQPRLTETFRFGQNLADILARYVYESRIDLVSAGSQDNLRIIVCNAIPTGPPAVKRQSPAELECIARFLTENPELRTDTREEAYAILAPYKNQVSLLRHNLIDERRQDRIMTIHKSQGREWDTVIVSVVDGRFNRPWFTDTTNSQSGGLYVINTAISRARKRLVIVCDEEFWSQPERGDQLIPQLL